MEKDFIDLYTQSELAERENKDRHTIGTNKRYIKVRYQNAQTRASFKNWQNKTPYWYKYISWDDVKKIAEKQFWKKITFI